MPAVPETMRAVGFAEPGGPEVLEVENGVAVPQPGPGEVLLKVAYAGVNRPDCIQRSGQYPPPPGASPILGLEASGEIVAVGDGVDASRLGEHVCALTPGGAYAEYCCVPAGHTLPVPEALTMAEAAAVPETLFTVWHNVFQRGLARDGETLLVHGGTSGIGTMATMLAKEFGLTTIVTAGSEEKCDAARRVGADHAIDYKTTDFVEAVGLITGDEGVDLVLDMVSGDYVARNLKCLKPDGRHVTIAVLGGMKAEINMALVMSKRLTLTGSTLRPRSDTFKAALRDEIGREAWPLFEEGAIRPVMDKMFALDDVRGAHERMEAGDHIGKIVLAIDESL